MAPNVLGKKSLYIEEATSMEPVQIISQPITEDIHLVPQAKSTPRPQYKSKIVWRNIVLFLYLHIASLYGLYYLFTLCTWKTFLWCLFILLAAGQGITAGAHRLWAHRTYKAKLPLRILLAVFQTMALQNDIHEWVRDHRVHHKFTDTDADPHNAKRGFFFSHMGWLLMKKHNDVKSKGATVDMSDVEADPIVRFQKKYYILLSPLMCFVFPAFVPWYYWNESFTVCWYCCAMLRYCLSLHGTWLVNSAAHIWGTKPYDQNIKPTENLTVAILAFGEGWHNYHHVFPWDYKAAELGNYRVNFSTAFIDLMAKIGWAYDLKTVNVEMIKKRVKRTGDGTRVFAGDEQHDEDGHSHSDSIWGWGDKDMKEEDVNLVEVHHKAE